MSNILVVDDERSIRITFAKFLTNEGFDVFSAENVDEALKILAKNPIDLVITDIIMPHRSGMDLIKEISELEHNTSILIMTGEPTVETATESLRYNASDYLQKPVNKSQLIYTVNRILATRLIKEEKERLEAENKIYRTNLEKLVKSRTEQIKSIMKGTIDTISLMLEYRDPYTAGHDRKVGNLAILIGKKLGLDNSEIEGLGLAGYLHDIGKISVPAEILSKPGKLSDLEFEIVKGHVQYSYDILKKIELPWPIAEMVYSHHERLDGSGYPRALKAKDIDITSRILMVSDVTEAMMSHRPYRAALEMDIVIDELEKGKGKYFDSKVVNAALEIIQTPGFFLNSKSFEFDFIV